MIKFELGMGLEPGSRLEYKLAEWLLRQAGDDAESIWTRADIVAGGANQAESGNGPGTNGPVSWRRQEGAATRRVDYLTNVTLPLYYF